jgi:hypothetical protein
MVGIRTKNRFTEMQTYFFIIIVNTGCLLGISECSGYSEHPHL